MLVSLAEGYGREIEVGGQTLNEGDDRVGTPFQYRSMSDPEISWHASPTALRFFVFAQGRWINFWDEVGRALLRSFEERQELFLESYIRDFLDPIRQQLAGMTDLERKIAVPLERELFEVKGRLSELERRIQKASAHAEGNPKRAAWHSDYRSQAADVREDVGADKKEASDVRSAVVNAGSIASSVRAFPVTSNDSWKLLAERYPGLSLYAIDADPRTFEVSEEGVFDGRASVLVLVPNRLPSGESVQVSATIPARVVGQLSPDGGIRISEFRLDLEAA